MKIIEEVKYIEVAEKLANRKTVALFQGRSEVGPRALGNRSMLYTSTDPNGKNFVNEIKGREDFRPLAGTILKEVANDWFDMLGMDESPYMTFSFKVRPEKAAQISSIIHNDGSCRIQTVSKEYNYHYYMLIDSFYQITGVPMILNTSLNNAREPIVETIDDVFDTFVNSKIDFLYLPELNYLLEK